MKRQSFQFHISHSHLSVFYIVGGFFLVGTLCPWKACLDIANQTRWRRKKCKIDSEWYILKLNKLNISKKVLPDMMPPLKASISNLSNLQNSHTLTPPTPKILKAQKHCTIAPISSGSIWPCAVMRPFPKQKTQQSVPKMCWPELRGELLLTPNVWKIEITPAPWFPSSLVFWFWN